jgi:hypothetical protein
MALVIPSVDQERDLPGETFTAVEASRDLELGEPAKESLVFVESP